MEVETLKSKQLTELLHEDSLNNEDVVNGVKNSKEAIEKSLFEPIPYEGKFAQEVLVQIPEFKWLKGVKCNLVYNDTKKSDREYLRGLYERLYRKAKVISAKVAIKEEMPLIAIDLETTGLNTSIKMVGGEIQRNIDLVGICLAISNKDGFYIPIKHTEEDGIPNMDLNSALDFLQDIIDNFYQIYHNAFYDMEVLSIHQIEMNTNYADTMLIANNLGMKEWDDVYGLGLKFLSGYILERKMLEINELMGAKGIIKFNRLASKDAVVYGCSDAMNTFGLFEEMVLKARDDDNPYKYNSLAMKLDTKVLNHLRGMFRHGFPLDYKVARGNFLTLINRMILFQKYFYSYEITQGYSIGSAEQVNVMFGTVLATKYLERYGIRLSESMDWNNKRVLACKKALYNDFGLEMKIKKLKASSKLTFATRKEGTTGVKVLSWILSNIDKWDFLDESLRDDIYWIANIVDKYRSMVTEQGRLGKMIRYVYNDDLNISRFGIALNLNGADTSRFSNKSGVGSFDRLEVKITKTGKVNTKYYEGDGIAGINAQGVPAQPYYTIKAKRMKVLPEQMLEYITEKEYDINNYYEELLITKLVKKK